MAQTVLSINKPTPNWARWTFRIFFYASSLTVIVLDIFTEIPPDVKLKISTIVIKANLFVHAISRLFGVDMSEYEIRAKAEEAIKEKKKDEKVAAINKPPGL